LGFAFTRALGLDIEQYSGAGLVIFGELALVSFERRHVDQGSREAAQSDPGRDAGA
jgi:hypothetical protein